MRYDNSNLGTGGITNGNESLVPLRGGCAGGARGGHEGAGGGAVQLVSGTEFRLADQGSSKGTVHVGGGGGRATDPLGFEDTGHQVPIYEGGGGGSGGGILIEAPSTSVLARMDPGLLARTDPGPGGASR